MHVMGVISSFANIVGGGIIAIMLLKLEQWPPLWEILHDEKPRETSRPEVLRRLDYYYWRMTEPWFWYCFDVVMFQAFGLVNRIGMTQEQWDYTAQKFESVYADNRFITNGHWDGRKNWLTGANLDGEDPEVATLMCGGGVLTGVENDGILEIRTLNSDESPPSISEINPKSHPWYFIPGTIVTTALVDGLPKVTPFPQLGGKTVYVPLVSKHSREPARMSVWDADYNQLRLRKLRRGASAPSPYRT